MNMNLWVCQNFRSSVVSSLPKIIRYRSSSTLTVCSRQLSFRFLQRHFHFRIFSSIFFLSSVYPFQSWLKTTDELFDLHINNAYALEAIEFCCCCWCLHLCSTWAYDILAQLFRKFCFKMSHLYCAKNVHVKIQLTMASMFHVCVSFFVHTMCVYFHPFIQTIGHCETEI